MPVILNIDTNGNVVDVTVSALPLTATVIVTPAVPPEPTGEVDADGNPIMTPGAPAVTEEHTLTAEELGSPLRTGCTQVILTDDQEAAFTAAQAVPNGGITFIDGAFAALPLPPPAPPPDPMKPLRDAAITALQNNLGQPVSQATVDAISQFLQATAPR